MNSDEKGQLLAYLKTSEVKLINRRHRIGFQQKNTVHELITKLAAVPAWAIVDDVELHDDGITTIEFFESVPDSTAAEPQEGSDDANLA